MRLHTPDDRVLQVDRVGGLHTYAARTDGGGWTAWGELRTVVVAATGFDPHDPWVDRVVAHIAGGEALSDGSREAAATASEPT